jgi:hypothetical protein
MSSLHQIPFFSAIEGSKRILLAGAGGGFDIYAGLPIYSSLLALGKEVTLANLSFADLNQSNSERVLPTCFRVKAGDKIRGGDRYFPEGLLASWLATQGIQAPVYAFARTGVRPLRDAYKLIARQHGIDTIVLEDGGTDSLMFGDEEGLGTPEEDSCSLAAASKSSITHQYLLSIGFGVDHFHGVSHFRFLENVARLMKEGGFLGQWQLTQAMPEAQQFLAALKHANAALPDQPSIVCNSIAAALEGEYGNHHFTQRTEGSHLWINPLMASYWAFDLRAVVKQMTYWDAIKDTTTAHELSGKLADYRDRLKIKRRSQRIPI